MKRRTLSTARLSFPLASAIVVLLAVPAVHAVSITWDSDATTTALPTDGGGAWLATNQWWDGAANLDWTSGDDAIFGNAGVGGAVTLLGPTTVNSLAFNSFTGTYTLGSAGQTITLNNGISKNVTATGAATLISPITLGAAQTWTNNSAGLLTVGTGAITNGSNLLTIDGTGNTTISSLIGSGDGGITKNGAGTLILSGLNTFTGPLAVQNGTLSTATANSVSVAGPLGSSGLAVVLGNTGTQTGTLSYTGATATTTKPFTMATGGIGVFNVSTTATVLTLSGLIDGSGVLTKSGGGTLTLSNASNSYSGGTVINAGTVIISANGNLGDAAGGITFGGTSTLQFGGAITSVRLITLSSGTATVNMTTATNHGLNGKVTGTGSLSFTQTGGNGGHNFTLGALDNDFTGGVSINSGGSGQSATLTVNSLVDSVGAGNISIGSNAGGVSAGSSTSFIYGSGAASALLLSNRRINLIGNGSNTNATGAIFSNLNVTHAVTVNTDLLVSGANGKLTLSAVAGPTNVFAGKITNSGSTGGVIVNKAGAGVWTLSGDNNFSGGLTISAGKLNIGSATAVGIGTITLGAASFDNTAGSALTLANNNVQTWNGDFTFVGTHSLNLGTGAVTLGGTRNIVVSANSLTVGGAIGAASAAPGIQKTSGAGTLVFNGANTYAGPTTVSAGTLQIGNANALGFGGVTSTTTSGTTASTGTLDLNGTTGVSEPITLSGNGISSTGALLNSNTVAQASIDSGIAGLKLLTASTGTAYSTAPTITISGTGSGATATASLGLTTASINTITNGGTASWAVGNTLSVTGGGGTGAIATVTSINGSGQITGLSITSAGNGYTSAPTTLTRLTGSGTGTPVASFFDNQFTVSGVKMTTSGSGYTGTPTYTFDSGDATPGTTTLSSVTLAANSSIGGAGNTTIDAVVSGGFGLTKIGAGTLTLTAANTYTGGTTVNNGTLAMGANNVLPDTAVSIGNATLDAATFTDSLGTLDVTSTAKINLGSGAALAFAPGSPAWSGTLAITGTFVSGASLKFGTDATGLTALQLAAISKPGFTSFALNGSGFLTATATAGGYSAWAAINAIGSNPDQDKDVDGVTNAAEYVLGGTVTTNDLSKLPAVSTSGGNLLFTFKRDQASIDGSTIVTIQVGTTLLTWPDNYNVPGPALANVPGVTIVKDTTPGFDTVTLSIPQAPNATKFARLNVVVTP